MPPMKGWRGVGAELPTTIRLATPIVAGFVGQMLMGWADTMMIGRVGVTALAACAFANTVSMVFFVFGFGLMSSVSVCASQAYGARRPADVGRVLAAGSVMGSVLSLILGGLLLLCLPWLFHLGQPEEVVRESRWYLLLIAFSMWPTMVFTAGKSFSEALSRPWLPFWVVLASVGLNVWLNWIFIFGHWGSPAMGLTGAGLATLLARIFSVVLLFALLAGRRCYRAYFPVQWRWRQISSYFPDLLRLGLPSGFQVLAEVGAFAMASLMMGWISVEALAAHQIALTCAATTFMVPLGLSTALTVRMGQVLGAKEWDRLRPVASGGMGLAAGIMTISAVVFLLSGHFLAGLFTSDAGVIALTAKLLVIAGLFQIFDGVQITAVGGLRGLGDVRVPMLLTYATYWLVALPLSGFLAFGTRLGAEGVWIGLAVGLGVAAGIMGWRLWGKSDGRTNPGNPANGHTDRR